MFKSSTANGQGERDQSCKRQHPSSRETPSTKLQNAPSRYLKFEVWRFSGVWSLKFGAFCTLCVFIFAYACALAQELPLPPRSASAPTGREFLAKVASLSLDERENQAVAQILAG